MGWASSCQGLAGGASIRAAAACRSSNHSKPRKIAREIVITLGIHLHTSSIPKFTLQRSCFWERRVPIPALHCTSFEHLISCKLLSSLSAQSDASVSESESKSSTGCKTIKRKVAMWVGYVGTSYKGLQIQRTSASGQTIEEELEKAIFKAGGILESNFGYLEKIRWMRSSRTDKGVHSLSTVISFKLEVDQIAWRNDSDGIVLADSINAHLPKSIRIFGIVPVNKSFDPRRGCSSRTYHYLLPARVVGINQDSSAEEVGQRLIDFQNILSSFEGRHPYHNYTVRARYRKTVCRSFVNVTRKDDLSEGEDDFTKLEDNVDASNTHSLSDMPSSSAENELISEDAQLESKSFFKQEVGEGASLSLPQVRWLHERDPADKINHAHFRKVFSFTCGGLETFNEIGFLKLSVHGESFMLHQIRKMVGTAIAIMQDVLPLDTVPISLSLPCRIVLPLAPSEGLFLANNEFFPFRSTFVQLKGRKNSEDLPRLRMSDKVAGRKEEFWFDVLLPEVVSLLKDSNLQWSEWLENLELGKIPEADMNRVRAAHSEWVSQKPTSPNKQEVIAT